MKLHLNKRDLNKDEKVLQRAGRKKLNVRKTTYYRRVEEFLSNVWENSITHNEQAILNQQEHEQYKDSVSQNWSETKYTIGTISKTSNLKTPEKDHFTNFWIKILSKIHKDLARAFTHIMQNTVVCSEWLTQGVT